MGNSESLLREEEINELKKRTPFTVKEINELLKRYTEFVSVKADTDIRGLTLTECLRIPEFSGSIYLRPVIARFLDESNTYLKPYQFIELCGLLSPFTTVQKKRAFLYEHMNLRDLTAITHEEVFRLVKQLYGNSLSDDKLLTIACQILNDPSLSTPGSIQKHELDKLITDRDIWNHLTINFYFS